MKFDVERVRDAIAEIVDREMMSRYRRLDPDAVRAKESPTDLVTIVDLAMERDLEKALGAFAPGAAFVGEEAAAADPSILDRIRSADSCWIVDPLDGTRNYVNHVDEFGTIVAYVERGETLASWIFAAPLGECAIGARGQGVLWRGEQVRVKAQETETPTGLRSTGWLKPEWRDRIVANLKDRTCSRSGHCAAYAYLKLIRGEVDFKFSSRINPWDHAAGALMLSELGGAARWLDDGGDYRPGPSIDRPYLATAPGRDWDEIGSRLRN
ncbi:MAG: inositol monophosphatase [Parvularculaceae bacterium]